MPLIYLTRDAKTQLRPFGVQRQILPLVQRTSVAVNFSGMQVDADDCIFS